MTPASARCNVHPVYGLASYQIGFLMQMIVRGKRGSLAHQRVPFENSRMSSSSISFSPPLRRTPSECINLISYSYTIFNVFKEKTVLPTLQIPFFIILQKKHT
jgi:hypothetical protein